MVIEMLRALKEHENSTLLDIGGNIGYYTLAAASAGHAVNAFEPVPLNAAMMQQSIERNHFDKVSLHTSALSSNSGELSMGLSKTNQGGVHHGGSRGSVTMLPSMYLDSVLPPETRPVYIKIDIEGGECNALKGMQNYISNSTKIIGVNMEFGQSKQCCSEWMSSGGFFHVLHFKHGLCPHGHNYQNICSVNAWDLMWKNCAPRMGPTHTSLF
jgi:FkbM family methyltransferase